MKILIIRHADPDYTVDGLTDVGKIEAECLADMLEGERLDAVYCSTLGRARLTAAPTLERHGMTAEYHEWLREFSYVSVKVPYLEERHICWDILPEYINTLPKIYSPDEWMDEPMIKDSDVYESYLHVCAEFDKVLAKHGYERDGYGYRAKKPNHDTIAFVCHFGLGAVLLAHLMNCSPYTVWQNMVLLPSSVTTIHTEERRPGIASMRASAIGDTSHLYKKGRAPSFSARFCECNSDDERHD